MSEENKAKTSVQDASAEKKNEAHPVSPGQQKRRERSVFQYIAILFAAAFVLLLFTFLMERRQYQTLNAEKKEQIADLQQTVSAVQSLQGLYNENDELKERVAALEQELQQAVSDHQRERTEFYQQTADQEKALEAMDWFWQIDEAYVRGRNSLCRSLIQNLEGTGLAEYLPKESTTDNDRFAPYDRYQEIKKALK